MRGAKVGAKGAEPGAGPVKHLARRPDRVFDGDCDVGRRSREARAGGKRRVRVHIGEQALGRADRVRHRDKLHRIERAAEPRASHGVADVSGTPQPAGGTRAEKVPRGCRLVLETLRLPKVRRGKKRFGELSPRRERGAFGEETSDRRELEPGERAFVHRRDTPAEPWT